ncbi:unnamed protein product [Strongylus vulgaris]|uniref:Uncharacterized protein n=1 Tax=Strongylus vulgaris TaxID=40348 RepID=A0A3P7IRT4_STRVU|nr:unnamed protein product [Strongylus vulgaris]
MVRLPFPLSDLMKTIDLFKDLVDDDQWRTQLRFSRVSGDVRLNREVSPDIEGENGIIEDDQQILIRSLQRTTMATPIVFNEVASEEYRWKLSRKSSRMLASMA